MDIKSMFNQYFVDVLKNHYADFGGRATRSQFWYFFLFEFVLLFAVALIASIINLPVLTFLAFLALICPYLGLAVRRMRDAGYPAYAAAGLFLPVISLVVLILLAMPSRQSN